MQEFDPISTPVVTPEVVVGQPKQNNFLIILLSILLFLSVSIAVFFAFQTQKLVRELTTLKTQEKVVADATTEPTIEPVATSSTNATTDPITNMKTYTSTKYGFSFKYPEDTKIMGDINSLTYTLLHNSKVVTVMIGSNSQKISINDYFLSQISPSDPQSVNKYISFIDLKNGDNNFVFAAQDPNYFKQQATGLNNYLISTGTNYVVNFNVTNSISLETKESLINQVMSTFKVLN